MGRHIYEFGGFTESANEWKKTANHSQLLLLYIKCACLVGVLLLFFDRFLAGFGFFVFMKYLSGNKEEDVFFAIVFLFNASIDCKFWCGCTVRSGRS